MGIPITDLRTILTQSDASSLKRAIVDSPFKYRMETVRMGLGITVLLLCNKKDKQIHRVALSRTELAEGTTKISLKKFEDIKIPMGHADNIISQAIATREPHMTTDWRYLFAPALAPEQARLNQAGGGIACSFVYPMFFGDEDGAMIFSYFKEPDAIGDAEREFMTEYARMVGERLGASDVDIQTYFKP
jgi:hypothetical protein